jgi:hypothetical protein
VEAPDDGEGLTTLQDSPNHAPGGRPARASPLIPGRPMWMPDLPGPPPTECHVLKMLPEADFRLIRQDDSPRDGAIG